MSKEHFEEGGVFQNSHKNQNGPPQSQGERRKFLVGKVVLSQGRSNLMLEILDKKMPITNPLRKAMIVIAVSKYNGAFTDLPGTLTSAERMASWAREPGEGRGYQVLEITDSDGEAVTVDRLKSEIKNFLETRIIDRLVVYFAGHGLVRSSADQYWLLTNAADDTGEGVDMNAFKRGLARQGIGANHPDLLKGQLCFIVDACRNTSDSALEFSGNPIVTSGGKKAKLQIDLFFATMLGDYAYQPKGIGEEPPYCLFSSILLEALEGNVPDVIEERYHPFSPAITNNRLADYLDEEVPRRAALFDERMEPDNNILIRMVHNYYDVFSPGDSSAEPEVPENSETRPENASERSTEREPEPALMAAQKTELILRTWKFEEALSNAKEILYEAVTSASVHPRIVIQGSRSIAVPRNAIGNVEEVKGKWVYNPGDGFSRNYPIFAKQGDKWVLAPFVDFSQTILTSSLPGDVLLHTRFPNSVSPFSEWDTSLSSYAALTAKLPLRVSDAVMHADKIRYGKAAMPNNANIAGYLYDFVGDLDNVARTAHYMAQDSVLPIDLALLAADRLHWEKTDGFIHVLADLPEVEKVTDSSPERPHFTTTAFGAKKSVPVRGIFPIFRQGWLMLAEAQHINLPPLMRDIALSLAGRSAVLLDDDAMRALADEFGYEFLRAEQLLQRLSAEDEDEDEDEDEIIQGVEEESEW